MTLAALLSFSADDAEKMSKEELEAFFNPYLNITRPERQKEGTRKYKTNGTQTTMNIDDEKMRRLQQRLRESGVDPKEIGL